MDFQRDIIFGHLELPLSSRNYTSGCSNSMPCVHKEYDIVEEYHHTQDTVPSGESMIYLTYNLDHLEEHQDSFIKVFVVKFTVRGHFVNCTWQ